MGNTHKVIHEMIGTQRMEWSGAGPHARDSTHIYIVEYIIRKEGRARGEREGRGTHVNVQQSEWAVDVKVQEAYDYHHICIHITSIHTAKRRGGRSTSVVAGHRDGAEGHVVRGWP